MKKSIYLLLSFLLFLGNVNAGIVSAQYSSETLIELEEIKLDSQAKGFYTMIMDETASGGKYLRVVSSDVTADRSKRIKELEIELNVKTTATHFIWLRYLSTSTSNDSAFAAVNDQALSQVKALNSGGLWRWIKIVNEKGVQLNSGINKINLYRRDPNLCMDAVYVTTDSSFDPNDTQPKPKEKPKTDTLKVQEPLFSEKDFLTALHILPSDFSIDKNITRAEAANLFIQLINKGNAFSYGANHHTSSFQDVPVDHQHYSAVQAAKDLGIIGGDLYNNYYPEREITYADMLVMILRSLGYVAQAEANGGYPFGFYTVAKSLSITNNISGDLNAPLNGEMGALLLYNMLFAEAAQIESISNGEIQYGKSKGTLLQTLFQITKIDGVVSDNGITSLIGTADGSTDSVTITEKGTGNHISVFTKGLEIGNHIGKRVIAYVMQNSENGRTELVYFGTHKQSSTMMLNSHKVISFANGLIEYEQTEQSFLKYNYDKNYAYIIFNGVLMTDVDPKDLISKDGFIQLTDNDNDKIYDVINIISFNYRNGSYHASARTLVIDSVSAETGYITSMFHSKNNLMLGEDADYRFIMSQGFQTLNDLSQYQVLSVAEAPQRINGKRFYYFLVGINSFYGEIETVQDDTIFISGKEYSLSTSLKDYYNDLSVLKNKGQMLVFIDGIGKVCFLNEKNKVKNYAYVIKVVKTNDFESKGLVKLITEKGSVMTFELAQKVFYNNGNTPIALDKVIEDLTPKFVKNSQGNITEIQNDNIILYSLNDLGQINRLYFAQAPSEDPSADQDILTLGAQITSAAKGAKVLGGVYAQSAVFFSIVRHNQTGEIIEDYCNVQVGFSSRVTFSNLKFYDIGAARAAKAALTIQLAKPSDAVLDYIEDYSTLCLFKKASQVMDTDGTLKKKIYFYQDGIESSMTLSDSAILIDKSTYALGKIKLTKKLENLVPGDLFIYETNNMGEIFRYTVLFDQELQNNAIGMLFLSEKGTGTYSRDIQLMKGSLYYKDSTMYTIKMELDNLIQHYAFIKTSAVAVYCVEPDLKRIRILSEGDLVASYLDNTGDSVILYGNQDTLKSVIIYK